MAIGVVVEQHKQARQSRSQSVVQSLLLGVGHRHAAEYAPHDSTHPWLLAALYGHWWQLCVTWQLWLSANLLDSGQQLHAGQSNGSGNTRAL